MEKNIKKLISDLDKILLKYEDRMPKIKGISNISRSDVESMKLRAECMLKGSYDFTKIHDKNIRTVFEKYGIDPDYNNKALIW